jgi:hypothetical protein
VLLLGTACATSEAPSQATECDALWAELQAARTEAQTYTIERVEGLSDKEIAELPDDPQELRLHDEVEHLYEAWQGAGCDQLREPRRSVLHREVREPSGA